MTGFSLVPPCGVFPRDELAFPANYDHDFCPRNSYERRVFLSLLDNEAHGSAFATFVHWQRR